MCFHLLNINTKVNEKVNVGARTLQTHLFSGGMNVYQPRSYQGAFMYCRNFKPYTSKGFLSNLIIFKILFIFGYDDSLICALSLEM